MQRTCTLWKVGHMFRRRATLQFALTSYWDKSGNWGKRGQMHYVMIYYGANLIQSSLRSLTHWSLKDLAAIIFADVMFKRILLNESHCILYTISLKCVSKGRIDNKSTLVQVMAWRRTGNKTLRKPMMTKSDVYCSVPFHSSKLLHL